MDQGKWPFRGGSCSGVRQQQPPDDTSISQQCPRVRTGSPIIRLILGRRMSLKHVVKSHFKDFVFQNPWTCKLQTWFVCNDHGWHVVHVTVHRNMCQQLYPKHPKQLWNLLPLYVYLPTDLVWIVLFCTVYFFDLNCLLTLKNEFLKNKNEDNSN